MVGLWDFDEGVVRSDGEDLRFGEGWSAIGGFVMILRKMGVMAVGDNFSGLRIDYRIFVYGCSRWEVMVQGSRA